MAVNKGTCLVLKTGFIPCGLAALVTVGLLAGAGASMRRSGSDTLVQVLPAADADEDIVIVDLGQWPLPEKELVAAMAAIVEGQPRTVVLDVLLDENSTFGHSADLGAVCALAENVVIPFRFVEDPQGPSHGKPRMPTPLMTDAAAAIGFANIKIAPDRMVRASAPVVTHGSERHLSLALQAVRVYEGLDDAAVELDGDELLLGQGRQFRLDDGLLPIAWTKGNFTTISLAEAPRAAAEGQFKDKLVIVGLVNPSAALDWHVTPAGRVNGATIQATIASQLLTASRWQAIGAWWDWLAAAGCFAGAAWWSTRRSQAVALLGAAGGAVIVLAVTVILAGATGLVAPALAALSGLALGWLGGTVAADLEQRYWIRRGIHPDSIAAQLQRIGALRDQCNAMAPSDRPLYKTVDRTQSRLADHGPVLREKDFMSYISSLVAFLREEALPADDTWEKQSRKGNAGAFWPQWPLFNPKGDEQHDMIRRLCRLRNWASHSEDRGLLGQVQPIFRSWQLPDDAGQFTSAHWREIQARATAFALVYMEGLHAAVEAKLAGRDESPSEPSDAAPRTAGES